MRARQRARRAAQVVTIGLALAGGCSAHHVQRSDEHGGYGYDATDAEVLDARASQDARAPDAMELTGPADAARDAGTDECDVFRDFEEGINSGGELRERCCNEPMRWSDPEYPGCYPWGPYVPPSEDAVPSSRSPQIREAVEAALRNVA